MDNYNTNLKQEILKLATQEDKSSWENAIFNARKYSNARGKIIRYKRRVFDKLIKKLNLQSIQDQNDRFTIVAGYLMSKNMSFNTAKTYIKQLKSYKILDKATKRLEPSKFNHEVQTRSMNMATFKIYTNELINNNFNKTFACLIFIIYTGLRYFELTQITAYTLLQLKNRENIISIYRKSTSQKNKIISWVPIYTKNFENIIDRFLILFEEEINLYTKHNQIFPLFTISNKSLNALFKSSLRSFANFNPPKGFGIHSIRNMSAELIANQTQNILPVKRFLQHSNIKTTEKYIRKTNLDSFTKELNEFFNLVYS